MELGFKNHNKKQDGYICTRKNNDKKLPVLSPWTIKKPHNHTNKYGMFKNNFERFIFRIEIFEPEIDSKSAQTESEDKECLSIVDSRMLPIFYTNTRMKKSKTYLENDDIGYYFLQHKLKKDNYFSPENSFFCTFQ